MPPHCPRPVPPARASRRPLRDARLARLGIADAPLLVSLARGRRAAFVAGAVHEPKVQAPRVPRPLPLHHSGRVCLRPSLRDPLPRVLSAQRLRSIGLRRPARRRNPPRQTLSFRPRRRDRARPHGVRPLTRSDDPRRPSDRRLRGRHPRAISRTRFRRPRLRRTLARRRRRRPHQRRTRPPRGQIPPPRRAPRGPGSARRRPAPRDHKRLLGHPETGPELIVRELGISELDVPPPPQRPCPRELAEEAAELAARGKAILIPPANGFLADEEIQARLAKIFDHYPDDEDLFHAWDAACPGLADLVGELAPTGSPIPIWNTSNSASPSPGRF